MKNNFDLIIVGSGPGGYVAAIRASQLGMKVGLVEKAEYGGVCLNWGCIPTKALLKSAQVFEYMKHAQDYGIEVGEVKPDFKKMIQRSRNVANQMSKGVEFLLKKNKIEKLSGEGWLVSAQEVSVKKSDGTTESYGAKNIIIATGARSKELPNIPLDGKKVIGYREAMTLPKAPKSMLVIGSGAIGVEFSYFYNALGTKVTIVEYLPRILPIEDEDISQTLEKNFKKKGINIITNAGVQKVEKKGEQCLVSIQHNKDGRLETHEYDVVLSAAGVVSNLENLGIEGLGIQTEKGKVLVDDYYATNVPHVYAIGDIVHGPALAHVASAEGIICVEKIAGKEPEPLNYGNLPGCTYCHPEVASTGYTEEQAIKKGYDIKVGKFPFSASGKAQASGASEGFVKVIFDAKYGEWLGAHMIGNNVTEMIAEVVAARNLETTGHEILKSVHPHPTMSEAIMEATAAAFGEVIHL